jgi:phage shock protein C
MKRLYRSRKERSVAGILGGIAAYLEVDPVFVRVIGVFLMILTGFLPFALAYLVAYFIVPLEPEKAQTGDPQGK